MGEVTYHPVMRKRRGLGSAFLGLFVGLILGFLILSYRLTVSNQQQQLAIWTSMPGLRSPPRASVRNVPRLNDDERINSSTSSLLFVGVMTAQKYLDTRAKAVYETWGKELPGKIAFFSSESSTIPENCPDLPLVPLPRVDDTYPPQKKSFMMLEYMWSNFGDRFEWFLRADDDVYVRTDRLEKLLRSVDSRRAMYIGQAGRGNSEEFGLLSLEYDENFCMGGPGVVLSRETLGRIVPHIKYCLRHLYTTHEDVELGRCVKKYAGIPCTWSYEVIVFRVSDVYGKVSYCDCIQIKRNIDKKEYLFTNTNKSDNKVLYIVKRDNCHKRRIYFFLIFCLLREDIFRTHFKKL